MPDALVVLAERPLHLVCGRGKRGVVQTFDYITTRMAMPVLKRTAYDYADRSTCISDRLLRFRAL